jgi:hypothetical protein
MKAEINARGILSIIPETPLEAFALHAWGKANIGMYMMHPGEIKTFEVSNLVLEFKGDDLFPGFV